MFLPVPSIPVLATTNPWLLFVRCDPVGQVITVLLGIFSLVAWTIMFGKHMELRNLSRRNHGYELQLREQKSLLELPESFRNLRGIPYADLFADAIEAYWRAAAIGKEKGEDSLHARLEHAENALQRGLAPGLVDATEAVIREQINVGGEGVLRGGCRGCRGIGGLGGNGARHAAYQGKS